jgi:exodeoxyribonuclease V gamma subunit
MCSDARALAVAIRAHISGRPLPPLSVDFTADQFRVGGVLHDVYPAALLRYRSATIKAKDLLRAWIGHLMLQVSATGDLPRRTLLFGDDALIEFRPVNAAAAILQDLLALYEEGLQTPLPFFPETSLEFARRKIEPTGRESADPCEMAGKTWKGGERHGTEEARGRGEREDDWFQLCFGHAENPLNAAWEALALRVYGPLLAAREVKS